jgi:hypothetical protein
VSLPPRHGALSLTCCARCSAHLAAEPQTLPSKRSGAFVYCGPCGEIVKTEQDARPCVPGARAVHVDYQRGPFADMVVREVRDDGRVLVFRLGAPDGVPTSAVEFHHTVGMTWFTRGELIMTGQ